MWGSFMLLMRLLGLGCGSARFMVIRKLMLTWNRLLFGVLYWYLVFVAIPKWYGYRVEEEVEVLSDETSITRLVNVKNE
jgi:hypothetical protein